MQSKLFVKKVNKENSDCFNVLLSCVNLIIRQGCWRKSYSGNLILSLKLKGWTKEAKKPLFAKIRYPHQKY
jgi:hypothetical protein